MTSVGWERFFFVFLFFFSVFEGGQKVTRQILRGRRPLTSGDTHRRPPPHLFFMLKSINVQISPTCSCGVRERMLGASMFRHISLPFCRGFSVQRTFEKSFLLQIPAKVEVTLMATGAALIPYMPHAGGKKPISFVATPAPNY